MCLDIVQSKLRLSRSAEADQYQDAGTSCSDGTRVVQPLFDLLLQLRPGDVADDRL